MECSSESSGSVEYYECIHFKYEFDDCETIDDVLLHLEELKKVFEKYKLDGNNLLEKVSKGYCLIDKIVDISN